MSDTFEFELYSFLDCQPKPRYFYRAVKNLLVIDTKLALSVAEEFNPDKVKVDHWMRLAAACNIRESYLKKLLQDTAETLLDGVTMIKTQFE